MAKFDVVVLSRRPVAGRALPGGMVCAFYSGAVGRGATKSIACRAKAIGRYVAIKLRTKNYLTLCEVRVFGKKGKRMFDVHLNSARRERMKLLKNISKLTE